MQLAAIEFARNVLGLKEADSTELNPDTPEPVISVGDQKLDFIRVGTIADLGAQGNVTLRDPGFLIFQNIYWEQETIFPERTIRSLGFWNFKPS